MTNWNAQKSRDLYNIAVWSGGYFDISDQGRLVARPRRERGAAIDVSSLVDEARGQGLATPILIRFVDVLHDRVDTLCGAFDAAIRDEEYTGSYTAVYPIKVNQHQSVLQEIVRHGGKRVGLEAGSKPELMAVMALSKPSINNVVVCNGYKDREYVRLALIAKDLGHRIFIVVEKRSELELVIREARDLNIAPLIGMRVRLASIGAGKWQNTGGEKSKFGLSATEVINAVARLREAGMLDSLQLLHCHLGSQIANIHDIQRGMREVARYYAELRRLGANIATVDVGGGLGIDYEGTRSRSFCSMNYTVDEYARNVVHALWEVCREQALPHPDVVTESGRALTAHHAMLVTNVVDHERVGAGDQAAVSTDDPLILQDMDYTLRHLQGAADASLIEAYHDASHRFSEAQSMYTLGVLNLEQRAKAEQMYFAICHQLQQMLQPAARSHRQVLDELNEKLADKYFCNFSVFQSLPDVWAIDQIFPIVPLSRLDEQPTRRGVVEDITCDSDGRIDYYVDREGVESSLPLHDIGEHENYLLGIFLVGAYQEILGDMHNLFGDTSSINVKLSGDGGHHLQEPRQGDSVDYVLRYVHFEAEQLLHAYKEQIDVAELDDTRRAAYLAELVAGLEGYTYLEER